MEHRALKSADRVLFTCGQASEAYRKLYPDLPPERIGTLYNSFDPSHAPAQVGVALESGTVDLLHFGNCYGPRKLESVIRAMHEVRTRRVLGAERLRLVNLGRPAATDLELVKKLKLEDSFRSESLVPYSEGIRRLSTAPVQILLGYGEEKLYVPAKTFDYFMSGAPVLSLSESTELDSMIEKTGRGLSVRPNDIEGVTEALIEVLKAARDGKRICEPRRKDVEEFSAPNAAGKLATTLNDMVGPRR
jgi:glycosyltransferase involved in cell wall biosynthesis